MGLWANTRRRNLFRVGGVYAVAAWLLAQVAIALETALGLPSWFDSAVVAALILGFPVALIIAWAFELTPEGIKRSAPDGDGSGSRLGGLLDAAVAAALLLVAGVALYALFRPGAPPDAAGATSARPAAPADLSIAVLPFVNMSSDPEQEYFSDGLSEELLNVLAQIGELRVAGRTSSFAFKGRNPNFQEIGETLGVAHVLEGSVRKSGDRLRITAQLVSADDGYHLWSETYDRRLDDVFAVQEEIAGAVADALSVTLGVGQAPSAPTAPVDLEAYDLVLRARALTQQATPEALNRAAESLRRAIAIDPDFVPAHRSLATVYTLLLFLTAERTAETLQALDVVVAEGLARAPDDPGVLYAKGILHMQRHEWLEADAAYERAIEAPGYAPSGETVFWTVMLANLGRVSDAIALAQAMTRADPLDPGASNGVQQFLTAAGRDEEAEAEYRRGLDFGFESEQVAHAALFRVWNGEDDALVRERFDRYIPRQVAPWPLPAALREVYDDADAARTLVRAAFEDPADQNSIRQAIIALYAGHFGDSELALAAARRAFVEMKGPLVNFLWFPDMAETRRTEGFKDLVRDMGLVDYWRTSGSWGDYCRPLGPDDFACE